MFSTTPTFFKAILVLLGAFSIVKVFYYFKFKREAGLTDFDKSLRQLKLLSAFFAVFIFAAAVFVPIGGWYREIDLNRSSQDVARDLVSNQERMGKELPDFREVWFF